MEIKVGIQHVNREVVMETKTSASEIEAALTEALQSDGLFTVTDEHGRKVLIPAKVVGYLEIGEENARRVGFGAS